MPPLLRRRCTGQARHRRSIFGLPLLILAALLPVALCLLLWSGVPIAGPAQALWRRSDSGWEERLGKGALQAFQHELPHWFHYRLDAAVRPISKHLPASIGAERRLESFQKKLLSEEHELVRAGDSPGGRKRQFLKWRSWLWEVCYVLGFTLPEAANVEGPPVDAGQLPHHPMCPELWIDKATEHKIKGPHRHNGLVWSLAAAGYNVQHGAQREPGILVLRAFSLRHSSSKEIKAIMGLELAEALAGTGEAGKAPATWLNWLTTCFVAARSGQMLTTRRGLARLLPSLLGRHARQANPLGVVNAGQNGLQFLGKHAGPATEIVAANWVIRRMVPALLRPFVPAAMLGGVFFGNRPVWSMATEVHSRLVDVASTTGYLRGRRFGSVALQLAAQTAGVGSLLKATAATMASRSRSATISVDRLAALAAGDADAAVVALVRSKRLLREDFQAEQLQDWLNDARTNATHSKWASRRKSMLSGAAEPNVEVRVHELLKWAEGRQGRQLLDLANLRRAHFQRMQLWSFGWGPSSYQSQDWWKACIAWFLILSWLLIPIYSPVEAIRWASVCTLLITALGILAPFMCWGSGGAFLGLSTWQSLTLAMLLALYTMSAGATVWWSHLLGGVRQWVELSAKLGTQLSDQADIAAGMAYLAQNWAEMAQRSLTALDEELCGSWRTSLQELASKLHDMQQLRISGSVQGNGTPTSLGEGQDTDANLWSKVDESIQRALAIETLRMRRSQQISDANKLKDMVQWWVPAVEDEPPMDYRVSNKALDSFMNSDGPIRESLANLFITERLQKRYEYVQFSSGEEEYSSRDVKGVAAEETFQRLESQLRRNTASLQALRTSMEPILERQARKLTLSAWPSMMKESTKVWAKLRPRIRYEKEAEDTKDERRVLLCLTGSAAIAALGAVWLVLGQVWLWALGAWSFSIANAILVLNHDRLAMPYVHQRLQLRIDELAGKKDAIKTEIYMLEKLSQKQGVAYLKALVHRQSVNVLRNINYMVLCIKTEFQQAVARKKSKMDRQHVLLNYLSLMRHLLPSDEQSTGWVHDSLSLDDCAPIAALLDIPASAAGQNILPAPSRHDSTILRSRLQEPATQRRLWLVFRLLHFSSAMPGVAQGQLKPLLEQTFRKVVVEGQLPLVKPSGVLALGTSSHHLAGESDSTSRGSTPTAHSTSSGERRRKSQKSREGTRSQALALPLNPITAMTSPARTVSAIGQALMRPARSS